MSKGTVYLLHFSSHYRHARHYLGFSVDLQQRLDQHHNGKGARLIQVISDAGIDFTLVRTWPGDRALERRLKRYKKSTYLCPICRQRAQSARRQKRADTPTGKDR